jgi:DEAD/DEAH box helicase domain-containing protein
MWQQTGRAGRTRETSLAIFIAGSSPLDQFIVQHPEFLFGGRAESITINPTNPLILNAHVKCSAFELPFRDGEQLSTIDVQSLLRELESALVLHHADHFWHWASEKFPATEVNLRASEIANVVIIDRSDATRVIGEMDYLSALTMLYEGAIYLHEGRQFHVDQFAIDEHKVYARPTEVDYYTDAEVDTDLSIIDVIESRVQGLWCESLGEIAITVRPSIYKKIKLETHENVGWGPIHLPAFDLHTTATWLTFPEGIRQHFPLTLLNSGLLGLATLLQHLAPIFALCDPRDLRAQPESRSKLTGQPVLYLYDTMPAGVGLAPHLYSHWSPLLHAAQAIIEECSCLAGCPSCVGPGNIQGNRKQAARQLLRYLLEDRKVGEFPDFTPSAPTH